jgi:hypothetical protein
MTSVTFRETTVFLRGGGLTLGSNEAGAGIQYISGSSSPIEGHDATRPFRA